MIYLEIIYSLTLMLAYIVAIRFTFVYVGVLIGRRVEFSTKNGWYHAIAIAVIINDFFEIFRW